MPVFLPPQAQGKPEPRVVTSQPEADSQSGWRPHRPVRTGAGSASDRRVTQANFQPALPLPPVPKKTVDPPAAPAADDSPPVDTEPVPPAPSPARVRIPLVGTSPGQDVQLSMIDDRVSLVARNASVQSILNLLAQHQGLNLIASDDLSAVISVTLNDVPFEDALTSIVSIAGYTWTQRNNIILVTPISGDAQVGPEVQGKVLQVFPLNFVSATDVELAVKGLLSPAGQSFISQATPTDKRRTQELIVVEDIPASVFRIAQYIRQIDQPPRQVMIEAHVLQVNLNDDTQHGVNWEYLTKIAGSDLSLKTVGFANPGASPASFLSLDGAHLDLLVEALKKTTDAKTLASPKVVVANGQEARIQIGEKLGYFVTTTTQTSTMQNVNFLNTGVVMRVTPQISADNRVLMQVRPEISSGRISPLGLPETSTTEAETTVLMEDGGGVVIGGLIKESDADTQDKIPILGDIWLVGRLFQRRQLVRQRSEIIIVLIPRIAPYPPEEQAAHEIDVYRANTPIFYQGLQPSYRPYEPRLPDAINNPRRLYPKRLKSVFDNPHKTDPKPLRYYFPTEDENLPQFVPPPPGAIVAPPVTIEVQPVQPQPAPNADMEFFPPDVPVPPAPPAQLP